ncbi:MAG: DUF4198 domain-containing protein [Acinetobacter sp.]
MKRLVLFTILVSSYASAHEPYVAPLAYQTQNSQIPIVAGYAEEALNSEFALKSDDLQVISPNNEKIDLKSVSQSKSTLLFDLALKEQGTYTVYTTASFPLSYVKVNNEWRMYFNVPADKAPAKDKRDFAIPADFKKEPKKVTIHRDWFVKSYVTKGEPTPLHDIASPIDVKFKTHPNQLNHTQPLVLNITKDGHTFANAKVDIRKKGTSDKEAIGFKTQANGQVEIKFPAAGEYIIEVSENFNSRVQPVNQPMTIISVLVN